jgi:Transcription factor WhiB
MSWLERAACLPHQAIFAMTFYTPQRNHAGRPTAAETAALTICATCPVQTQCLNAEYQAMEHNQTTLTYGVVGGLTAWERTTGRRMTPPPTHTHGTLTGYQQHQTHNTPACPSCRAAKARQYNTTYRKKGTTNGIPRVPQSESQTTPI